MDNEKRYDTYRHDLLQQASRCWESGQRFRADRERNKRFTYGDQWSDEVDLGTGRIREDEHLMSKGHVPLKNNLIRRLVRNVLGVFRDRWQLPAVAPRDSMERIEADTMRRLLHYNAQINRLGELYARTMEEFLISGVAVHKKWYGRKGSRSDCWTDFVQPDNFFADGSGRDFRGWDISLVGELHEMEPTELVATFARSGADAERLRAMYAPHVGIQPDEMWSARRCGAGSFLTPSLPGRCRVIEVWVRQHPPRWRCHDRLTGDCWKIEERDYHAVVERVNRERSLADPAMPQIEARWFVDDEWHWYFLTPAGCVLESGVSPYRHGGHPYVFKAYPFIDGEVHSFVSDIIDQQKLTNRLISMYDWILQASAKGVLLMPEDALPRGVSLDDIADEWSRFDGVILFRPHAGSPLPQQISSKAVDIGITELLNIQMKMMEDISGVNGALQGKLESGSVSGTLYNQQTRNSLTALSDLMQCFDDFIRQGTATDASNIGQFYSRRRIEAIAGKGARLDMSRRFDCSAYDFSFDTK